MAVISELIDIGLSLKEQGNHQNAIEHFRQLNQTYPNHARIMFELAGSWQAFGVPEQALPLYQQLMALPKSQGLPPKDMPRLYTQLGASLRLLGQFTESLEIIEEGLKLYPEYRPLRAYRMFALHSAGYHQNAMLDAMELMLQSLAPTKWDLYEEEILSIVGDLRERVPEPNTDNLEEWVFDEYWTEENSRVKPEAVEEVDSDNEEVSIDAVIDEATAITNGESVSVDDEDEDTEEVKSKVEPPEPIEQASIQVDDDTEDDETFEVEVKVVKKTKPKPKQSKPSKSSKKDDSQFGKRPVKININDESDDSETTDDEAVVPKSDDDKPTTSGKINIPIDLD